MQDESNDQDGGEEAGDSRVPVSSGLEKAVTPMPLDTEATAGAVPPMPADEASSTQEPHEQGTDPGGRVRSRGADPGPGSGGGFKNEGGGELDHEGRSLAGDAKEDRGSGG